jgi:hypothetical protein
MPERDPSRSSPADDALKRECTPAGRSAGDKGAGRNPATPNTDSIDLGAEPTGVGRGTEAGTKGKPQSDAVDPGNQTRSRQQQGADESAHLPTEHAPDDPRTRAAQMGDEDADNMLL